MDTTVTAFTELSAPEQDSRQVGLLVFYILAFIIGVIGVVGNGIVLHVIYISRKTKKSRLQNAFIINQTAMDLVSSVFIALTFLYRMTPTIYMEGVAGLVLCICLDGEGLLWTFLSASMYTLMSLTLERYIKIVFPIRHHTSFTDTKKATLLAMSWVFPICWFLSFIVIATEVKDGQCYYQGNWSSDELALFYGWTSIIMLYFLPLAFFVFSYGHMFWTLHKRNSQIGTTTNQPGTGGKVSRAQVNIIKTMVLVSAFFIVLWTPAHFYYFFYIIGVYKGKYMGTIYYVTDIICFTNSVINPFIYALKIVEFRGLVLEMFGMKKSTASIAAASSTGGSAAPIVNQ